MEKDEQDSPGLRAADQNSKGEACRAGGKTQMDECKALTGCHPLSFRTVQLSYRVSLQRAFLFLPWIPTPPPWELLCDTGASSQLEREAGEPCLLQGQTGS